jgi:hypothetical protein
MAGEKTDDGAFEPGEFWDGKVDFAPGVPDDPADGPTLEYQVLAGNVYSTTRWPDGSVARGQVDLSDLADLAGKPITREGFYSALGEYKRGLTDDL